MSANVTNRAFPDELPRLLGEKGMTLRGLAREVGGVDHAYLSRMLNRRTAVFPRAVALLDAADGSESHKTRKIGVFGPGLGNVPITC